MRLLSYSPIRSVPVLLVHLLCFVEEPSDPRVVHSNDDKVDAELLDAGL